MTSGLNRTGGVLQRGAGRDCGTIVLAEGGRGEWEKVLRSALFPICGPRDDVLRLVLFPAVVEKMVEGWNPLYWSGKGPAMIFLMKAAITDFLF